MGLHRKQAARLPQQRSVANELNRVSQAVEATDHYSFARPTLPVPQLMRILIPGAVDERTFAPSRFKITPEHEVHPPASRSVAEKLHINRHSVESCERRIQQTHQHS